MKSSADKKFLLLMGDFRFEKCRSVCSKKIENRFRRNLASSP